MIVDLISFSFNVEQQPNSNYLIDVRSLNNPFYLDELREKTGLDKEVISFFEKDDVTKSFLSNLYNWIIYILELNIKTNKEKITIAIGCTGGQHRSPYIIECLAKYLSKKNPTIQVNVHHRELSKYNVSISA